MDHRLFYCCHALFLCLFIHAGGLTVSTDYGLTVCSYWSKHSTHSQAKCPPNTLTLNIFHMDRSGENVLARDLSLPQQYDIVKAWDLIVSSSAMQSRTIWRSVVRILSKEKKIDHLQTNTKDKSSTQSFHAVTVTLLYFCAKGGPHSVVLHSMFYLWITGKELFGKKTTNR